MLRAPRALLAGALVCALPAAVATPVRADAQGAERHTLRGRDVAVYNVAGRVRVVAGAGDAVTVEVTRRGPEAGALRVAQGEIGGRETLRVVYPDADVIYPELGGRWSRTQLRVRDDGTFGAGRQITVRGDGRGTEAWADLVIAVPAGRKIAVHLAAGDAAVAGVDGDVTVDVHAATVTTERTKGRLVVDAGSGRVQVAEAEGDVLLDTGSGAVEMRAIRATRLRVDAGSGSITGDDLRAPAVDLDLGSGRTRLSGVRARELRIDAGSGSVDVGLLEDVDDLRVDSGSGSVTLRLPASLGAQLDVETGSGGIETEMPITVTRRERRHLVGSIGDGKGRIVIDAGSGGIRLLRAG